MPSRWCRALIVLALSVGAWSANAVEACVGPVNGVQIVAESNGSLTLYVYSQEIQTIAGSGSAYLVYPGTNVAVLNSFQSLFLFSKATGHQVCVVYQPSTPTYRLVLSSVSVADE